MKANSVNKLTMMRQAFRRILVFAMVSLAIAGCSNDLLNDFPADVSFDISAHLLGGKRIDCLTVDDNGKAFICSGTKLYITGKGSQEEYDLGCEILDIEIAPDHSVWLGSNGMGLGCFSDGKLRWYNSENSGLPRDYVRYVEIGSKGRIWFSSSAYQIGGLGLFDGKKFEFMTPENSPLNQNMIEGIEAGKDGIIYVATTGTTGKTNIYRITEYSWDCLGDEEGTFYWVFSFAVGPSGNIYLVEDFSLSSAWTTNRFFMFNGNDWQTIEPEDSYTIGYGSRIRADLRNYCWLAGGISGGSSVSVFDGARWHRPREDFLEGEFITALEVDSENNIWIGTFSNGVIVLNQK